MPSLPISGSGFEKAPIERTVCLVSCVGRKMSQSARARDLYQSVWFTKARVWVEASGSPWFILSAEYGLVHPHTIIDPYNKTLNTMGVAARRKWAAVVAEQLKSEIRRADCIVLLAGARYREFLMPVLRDMAKTVEVPMEGMRIGEQLQWLANHDTAR
jgi:hypothetical protein